MLTTPRYPAQLWSSPRVVTGDRAKCWHPACLTICGSQYSGRFVCARHAGEQSAIERAAEPRQAVAR
jgi:hypothetical protein